MTHFSEIRIFAFFLFDARKLKYKSTSSNVRNLAQLLNFRKVLSDLCLTVTVLPEPAPEQSTQRSRMRLSGEAKV